MKDIKDLKKQTSKSAKNANKGESAEEAAKTVKVLEEMQSQVKESLETLLDLSREATGLKYMWYEQKIEEPFLKLMLAVGFEMLENLTKHLKDKDLKGIVFELI